MEDEIDVREESRRGSESTTSRINETLNELKPKIEKLFSLLDASGLKEASLQQKVFHILVYILAAKETIDVVSGGLTGDFRLLWAQLDLWLARMARMFQLSYQEALRIARGRSRDVLEYFNTTYELTGINRLTSQAQLAAFLTRRVPGLLKTIQQWECKPLEESVASANRRHVTALADWWTAKYIGLALLIATPMIFLGATAWKAYGTLGGIIGAIAPLIAGYIVVLVRRAMRVRARRFLNLDEGGVSHVR